MCITVFTGRNCMHIYLGKMQQEALEVGGVVKVTRTIFVLPGLNYEPVRLQESLKKCGRR
jgi:hypothetical protein